MRNDVVSQSIVLGILDERESLERAQLLHHPQTDDFGLLPSHEHTKTKLNNGGYKVNFVTVTYDAEFKAYSAHYLHISLQGMCRMRAILVFYVIYIYIYIKFIRFTSINIYE